MNAIESLLMSQCQMLKKHFSAHLNQIINVWGPPSSQPCTDSCVPLFLFEEIYIWHDVWLLPAQLAYSLLGFSRWAKFPHDFDVIKLFWTNIGSLNLRQPWFNNDGTFQ